MFSGFDRPAKNLDTTAQTSQPLESSAYQAGALQKISRVEPPTISFDSPFPVNNETVRTAWTQHESPRSDLTRFEPERIDPVKNESALKLAAWDPSRPGWDQPQLERRKTPASDASDFRPPHERVPLRRPFETYNLSNRLDARTMSQIPDAKVFVNTNFDPSKPINLIIYNHGWNDTINSAFRNARLQEQMAQAPPNSILVVPSWQAVDGAASGVQSDKFKQNVIGMIDAAVKLNGKTLRDISNISIVSHSAGYNAVDRELNSLKNTPLYDRISTIANLDSQYETKQSVDDWIAHNLRNGKFANGQASFLNLWTSETRNLSQRQAQLTLDTARRIQADPRLVSIDFGDGRRRLPVDPSELSRAPIVFANSRDSHGNLPKRFFGHAISKLRSR